MKNARIFLMLGLNRPKKSLRYWLKNPESNLHFCFNTEIGLHLKYWIKRK